MFNGYEYIGRMIFSLTLPDSGSGSDYAMKKKGEPICTELRVPSALSADQKSEGSVER